MLELIRNEIDKKSIISHFEKCEILKNFKMPQKDLMWLLFIVLCIKNYKKAFLVIFIKKKVDF